MEYISDFENVEFAKEFADKYDETKDFITLECWKQANELKMVLYKEVISSLPEIENFNLNIQI